MATVRYTHIDSKHSLDSYEAVLDTCSWLECAIKYSHRKEVNIEIYYNIELRVGEMSFTCESIDEFKKNAFGRTFEVEYIFVGICKSFVTSVYVRKNNGVLECSIESNDEVIIADVKYVLSLESLPIDERVKTVNFHYEDNSINIGNGNTIVDSAIGSHNGIEHKSVADHKETWFSRISWNIIVPIIVGLAVIIIAAWLGLES